MVRVVRRPQEPAAAPAEEQSAEDIVRQIEALKAQIQQIEVQEQAVQQDIDDDEYEYEEYEEIIEEIIEDDDDLSSPRSSPRSSRPVRRYVPGSSNNNNTGPPPQHHDHYRKQMDSLKQQYAFEKPAWAAPAEVTNKEEEIDKDSINNPMLKKAEGSGYVRQVKEKELGRVQGTFVKPQQALKLEPRLAWIVVNINKRKVGKIVMHLYGKDVSAIVDQFVELKGHELERKNGMVVVVGMEPTLYVTSGGPKGLDGKAGVYGVIQEGKDIYDTLMGADAGAVLSVKQAHIFPVKKGGGS